MKQANLRRRVWRWLVDISQWDCWRPSSQRRCCRRHRTITRTDTHTHTHTYTSYQPDYIQLLVRVRVSFTGEIRKLTRPDPNHRRETTAEKLMDGCNWTFEFHLTESFWLVDTVCGGSGSSCTLKTRQEGGRQHASMTKALPHPAAVLAHSQHSLRISTVQCLYGIQSPDCWVLD